MRNLSPTLQSVPLDIVGSTAFGRYPKISTEQTFNMIISDDWLVPYAGYTNVASINPNGEGRGIYASQGYNHLIVVINDGVYAVSAQNTYNKVANIATFTGDVFIAENNAGQIAICDKKNIYIFDYITNTFAVAVTDFLPGYITFQDTYFISVDLNSNQWRLSGNNDGTSWPADASHVGEFQTKPDRPIAAVRMPSKGNLLLVFGSQVVEPWYDVGYQLFPFQKNTYDNIDYGCFNPATIAQSDKFVIWLGGNEKSGPVIMFSDGGSATQISNDGINFKLAQLKNPENSYGFIFKQDGHLLYQITFPDITDNVSYIYDFNTKRFFTVTDEKMNFHIAKRLVYFNNTYYFVAFNDGNVYIMNSQYTTYNGKEIPRVRVCKPIRMPNQTRFVVNNITFTIEQGDATDIQRVDMSVSKNGGESFSNYNSRVLNKLGKRQNRLNYWNLGAANDFVAQFRFYGMQRFVCTNGMASIYQ